MILNVEAGSLTHVLDIVRQVANQALFPQFGGDRRFESDDVPSLLSRHKARASCCHYMNLFWRERKLLTVDCEAERACLIEQFGCLTNAVRIKRPECCQGF